VDPIFEALSYCASLHPDPQGSDDGDDDDDDDGDVFIDPDTNAFEVFTGDEGEELSEVGRVRSAPTNDNRYEPY
jgi:nucleotide-sensitive chloride channel 1A